VSNLRSLEHIGVGDNHDPTGGKMTDEKTELRGRMEHSSDDRHKPEIITVIVDGVERRVPEGTYVVSAFKQLVGVDASRELDEVVHGEFKPLNDSATITVEEREKFVSHVRTGSSS
jgi:hypothetical protein